MSKITEKEAFDAAWEMERCFAHEPAAFPLGVISAAVLISGSAAILYCATLGIQYLAHHLPYLLKLI